MGRTPIIRNQHETKSFVTQVVNAMFEGSLPGIVIVTDATGPRRCRTGIRPLAAQQLRSHVGAVKIDVESRFGMAMLKRRSAGRDQDVENLESTIVGHQSMEWFFIDGHDGLRRPGEGPGEQQDGDQALQLAYR